MTTSLITGSGLEAWLRFRVFVASFVAALKRISVEGEMVALNPQTFLHFANAAGIEKKWSFSSLLVT